MTLRRIPRSLFPLLAALLLASPLAADGGESSIQPPACSAPEDGSSPATAALLGMRVVLDEATGKLRPPTAEEAQRFGLDRPAEQKDLVSLPGLKGGTLLLLDDRFHKQAVATVGESGEVTVMHDVLVLDIAGESAARDQDANAAAAEEVMP